jgi:hypothetical protein
MLSSIKSNIRTGTSSLPPFFLPTSLFSDSLPPFFLPPSVPPSSLTSLTPHRQEETKTLRQMQLLKQDMAAKDMEVLNTAQELERMKDRAQRLENALQNAMTENQRKQEAAARWEFKSGEQQQQLNELERSDISSPSSFLPLPSPTSALLHCASPVPLPSPVALLPLPILSLAYLFPSLPQSA